MDEDRESPTTPDLTPEVEVVDARSAQGGRRMQTAIAVGAAILSIASAAASILGQEIQYRQMRAIEKIADHCLKLK